MGCFASKHQDLYIDIPRTVSTTDTWALRQKSFVGGCKLLPFTAGCPASYPYQSLTRVVLGEGHLFAALWEGHAGSQAARHCVANCYETLLQCLQSNPDPCWALRQTTQLLDKSYLASQDYPDIVKASVGATGIMLFINTRTNQCCIARLGDGIPFLTESKGSFNTTSVDVKYLTSSKAHKAGLSQLQQNHTPSRGSAYSVPDSDCDTVVCTHAVGFGYGKSAKLQQLWLRQQEDAAELKQQLPQLPFISNTCEVTMSQLSSADETLVLASEGLLQVLAPQEVGLLLHHFNAAKLTALKQALAVAAIQQEAAEAAARGKAKGKGKAKGRSSKELQPDEAVVAAGKAARHPNVANIVMHHALIKALEKHNLALQKKEKLLQQHMAGDVQSQQLPRLSYDQLVHLPLVVDTEAFRPQGAKASGIQLHLPKHYATSGLCKRDVHGDMGLVVISLNWPRSQDAQPLPGLSPQRAGRATIRPDAQYRWQLLRLAVKFHMAYRRALRRRWWELGDAVEAAAGEAAKQAEVHAWKVMGAAVKVNLAGDVMAPEAPMRSRHSPHKPPAQLSPKKRGTPMRSSATSLSSSTYGLHTPAGSGSPAAKLTTPPRSAAAAAAASGMQATGTPSAAAVAEAAAPLAAAVGSVTPKATVAAAAGSALHGSAGRGRNASRPAVVPARLEVGFEREIADDAQSDLDSPSRLDSPSKAAKSAAALAAAVQPPKKAVGLTPSPTKPYKKDNLSLRSSMRMPATAAAAAEAGAGSASPKADTAGLAAEASWGTVSSVGTTPGQLRASTGGIRSTPGSAAAAAAKSSGSSPVKRPGRATPTGGGSSSRVEDYSGYHASGYPAAAGGRVASPTKLGRAGKISLRRPASHY